MQLIDMMIQQVIVKKSLYFGMKQQTGSFFSSMSHTIAFVNVSLRNMLKSAFLQRNIKKNDCSLSFFL